MTETQLTAKILKALRKRGGFWFKVHGNAFQMAGIPDILGCYRGRFVGLEVKLPGKEHTLSPRQRLILQRLSDAEAFSAMITTTRGALKVIEDIDATLLLDG